MDLETLNRHFEFRKSLNEARQAKAALEAKIQPRAQALTGMPKTPGVKDFVSELAIEMVRLDDKVKALEEAVKEDAAEIERFIDSIDNLRDQMYFRLRYLYALQWKEVVDIVGGTGASVESVKAICYRYIDRNPPV